MTLDLRISKIETLWDGGTFVKSLMDKKRLILLELGLSNGLLAVLSMSLLGKISWVLLLNIAVVNGLLSYLLYKHFSKTTDNNASHRDRPQSNQTLDADQRQKMSQIQHWMDQGAYDKAMSQISDYAMTDYKDLIEKEHLPYVLAVLLGRYRKICAEEGIAFHLQIHKDLNFNNQKMNFAVNLLGNLLENALEEVRQLKTRRKITVQIEPGEAQVCYRVFNTLKQTKIDTEAIFKPGFSTKKSQTGSRGDRGYGLALVMALVEENDGQIRVYLQDEICFEVIL